MLLPLLSLLLWLLLSLLLLLQLFFVLIVIIVVVASVVVGIGVGVANVGDDDYNLFAALNLESVSSERSIKGYSTWFQANAIQGQKCPSVISTSWLGK
jgi:hypothetical protein